MCYLKDKYPTWGWFLALNQRLPILSFSKVTADPKAPFLQKNQCLLPYITWKPVLNDIYLEKNCHSERKKKIYFLIFFGVSIQLRKVMPLFRHRLVIFCNCDHFLFSLLLSSGLWRHSITGGKDDGSDVNESKCCFFPSHQGCLK